MCGHELGGVISLSIHNRDEGGGGRGITVWMS
jgi:hypothetical protein